MNLTTLARFKTYSGITGTASDAQLNVLIPQVSDMIARQLGIENMESAEQKDWIYPDSGDILRMPSWPITEVYGIYNGVVELALVYKDSGSTVITASVLVTSTGITLLLVNNEGTASSTSVTYADNKTMTAMKTAIEENSGWHMTINSGYEYWPTVSLKPRTGIYAVSPDKVSIYSPDWETTANTSFQTYRDVMRLTYSVNCNDAIFVHYKAGYVLPTDLVDGTLPSGLLMLVNKILRDMWTGIEKSGMLASESIADYSYSRRTDVLSIFDAYKTELNLFRRKTI